MLQPRRLNCSECTEISTLIEKIDCKLAKLGASLYANVTLMANNTISLTSMMDLSHYRRILQYKQVNPDYCEEYTTDLIAGRVNILIYK